MREALMAQPLLLTYNLDGDTAAKLDAICRAQGIRVRSVNPFEFALPIGAVPASTFADGMLVMCHMLSDQLDAFLRGMRMNGVPRIPLKAVLTPINVSWDSLRLHDELARENAAMGKRQ